MNEKQKVTTHPGLVSINLGEGWVWHGVLSWRRMGPCT